MITDAQLSEELERLRARLAGIKRRRSPVEAPLPLTNGYVELLVALGHTRLQQYERASAIVEATRATMLNVAEDPVHAWLISAFEARIAQSRARCPIGIGMPDDVVAAYAKLDHVSRYKIDRFREVSALLEPSDQPDALIKWSHRRIGGQVGLTPARTVADALSSFDAIENQLGAFERIPLDQRAEALVEYLAALSDYSEVDAMPLVIRIIDAIGGLATRPLALWAHALRLLARFGWGELVESVRPSLFQALRETGLGPETPLVISATARSLRRLGLHAELTELIAIGRELVGAAKDSRRMPVAFMLAGVGVATGDSGAIELVAETERASPSMVLEQLARHRRLAVAYAHMDPVVALDKLAPLLNHFAFVSDSFRTNSHFSINVIEFVDALVHAFTLLSITRG